MQVYVEAAKKYYEDLGVADLISILESFKAVQDLYYYLGSIVNFSKDPVIYFKYMLLVC
jgi:clathrin heavy chain